jgi:adenosyl cobinamide kinase/adenosyl cobinamide phosphate guanylyltransferase
MSRLILITGGARAGKSRFAQKLAETGSFRKRLFVATAVPCDAEMRRRIARHRRSRDGQWATLEESTHLPERLPEKYLTSGSVVLFDCLPTFVTNLLMEKQTASQVRSRIRRLLQACQGRGECSIFVTNEVGLGIVPDHPLGRQFRDLLGQVNQEIAKQADEVYFLVAGIPWRLK